MKSSRKLAISDQAAADLRDIRRHTARQWGPQQRDRYTAQLQRALRSLRDYPERGRPRDELYAGCRGLPVGQHIAYYYLTDDEIIIDRILHSSHDAAGELAP